MSSEPRIAYSFTRPAFDLDRMRPDLWQVVKNGQTLMLSLQPCWEDLLPSLSKLDLLMACAVTPAMSVATALAPARLTPLPGGDRWLCLETAMELDASRLVSASMVIEGQGEHTFASLQFFDRHGDGALKLLATNGTDLKAFHHLARQFGIEMDETEKRVEDQALAHRTLDEDEASSVRAQWLSLSRTLPENDFPGLNGVTRLAALRAAEADLAWRVPAQAARAAVSVAMLNDAPVGAAVRTPASFLPAGFYPQRCSSCGCGATYFSDSVQLTLRQPQARQGEVWVVRFANGAREVCCLEFYDDKGRFTGGIGLRPEAAPKHHQLWNSVLSGNRAVAAVTSPPN